MKPAGTIDIRDPSNCYSLTWVAYQRLQNALGDAHATKRDLRQAMIEASAYLEQIGDL